MCVSIDNILIQWTLSILTTLYLKPISWSLANLRLRESTINIYHNTPFSSYCGRCSFLLNSAGKISSLWIYSGWVFLRLLTDGWGGRGSKKPPLPKICLTYPTIMELATVIPYLKKDLINHLTHPLSYADTSIFSSKIRKFCYFKKRS